MALQHAVIHLNSRAYTIRMPIRHYDVDTQTPAYRTTGQFLRQNNPKLESYAFNDWDGGFGARMVRPGHLGDLRKFFDATVLTIHRQALTLPITEGAVTDIATSQIVGSTLYNGSLWAIWSPVTASDAVVARTAGASWTGGGNVLSGGSQIAFDLIAADKLYAFGLIFRVGDDDHVVRYSTDGVTWTAPATTPITVGLAGETEQETIQTDPGRLAFDGTRIIVVLWDSISNIIRTYSSTNGGDTWAETTGCRFNSSSGVTGAIAYLDTDDTINIYVATANVLKMVDIGAATQSTILNFNGNTHNGRRLTVHNGSLYVPIDNGTNAPFGMKRITVNNGGRVIEDVGLDIEQAIPADLLGNVRWMRSFGPWLFIAVGGGAASRNARILAHTGLPGHGWQQVYRYGTANDIVPWFDLVGSDLYLQQGGATSADAGDTIRLLNVVATPNSGVTFSYQATADLELPEFGADAPEEDSAFLQVQIEASDLVDGAEVVDFEYGVNGANPTTAGPTLNATNRRQDLASGVGVSGRTMRGNWEFNRGGTTGNTPKVREAVLLFRKRPAHLHGWELEIDADETARQDVTRSVDDILTDLETANHSVTLVVFQEAGQEAAVNVEVASMERIETVIANPMMERHSQLSVVVKVRLEQVLA